MALNPTPIFGRRLQIKPQHLSGDLVVRLKSIPGVTRGRTSNVFGNGWTFQCPPLDQFSRPRSRSLATYTNYKGDEFASAGGTQLDTVTFRTMVVEWANFLPRSAFMRANGFYSMELLVQELHLLIDEGYPVNVLAHHEWKGQWFPEIHQDMILTGFTPTENAGEPDARYLDITFTQWRHHQTDTKGLRQRSSSGGKYKLPMKVHLTSTGNIHFPGGNVDNNATLASLSVKVYGKSSAWATIAQVQKPPFIWGAHTKLIDAPRFKGKGGEILLPDLSMSVPVPLSAKELARIGRS